VTDPPYDTAGVSATMEAPGSGRGGALEILARGTRVGRYEVEYLLGSGGLGMVYAAHDPELGRRVALKLLHVEGAGQERLVREARALARVAHPNVVAVHDVGRFGDRAFVAMALVVGRDLRAWLSAAPRRSAEIVDVFLAAGRGLAAAHAAGLVHRDFKPENVLVGDDGRVYVTDFGLARAVAEKEDPVTGVPAADPLAARLTQAGFRVGTPAYMAPEQHLAGYADAHSDQWAFCLSLYEALYRARPFDHTSYERLRADVLVGRMQPPPREARVPSTLSRIVHRGLRPAPEERWPSMAALLGALGRDRRKLPRRLAALAAAVLAVVATAAAGDWVARARHAAVAREAFAAAHRAVERAVAFRWETFVALAELSTMLPILREAAAARDQAAFGLGSASADAAELAALHDSLRDADWDAWSTATRRGAVAVADSRGRLLYSTGAPDRFGVDVRPIAPVYTPGTPATSTTVLGAGDPVLHAAGLAAGDGLILVFARATVVGGVPQAALIQTLAGRRLLDDLAEPDLTLGLVAADGATDGDLPHGGGWLVDRWPLPGVSGATLILARPADVGLAGLFPGARAVLAVVAALAVAALVTCLVRLRPR
jgi:hypothetical protein